MALRRALVVGIDDYPLARLAGCVNDAKDIAGLLGRHHDGSPNFDVRLVTGPPTRVTRAVLRQLVEQLFKEPADVALLYFCGHGTENNLGGFLLTHDAAEYDDGIPMTEVLALANSASAREVVILLDCCHSGAMGKPPAVANDHVGVREGVSILTASRSGGLALETGERGIFTSLVVGALEGGAADAVGRVTVASVYSYVDESLGSWEQRPLFTTHLSTLVPLRIAQPAIDVAILRMLPEWFPSPVAELPLDPTYEPDKRNSASPVDRAHERIFADLQKCRAAKLVEPVGEDHMYYVAIKSKSCRLTPLGRHYWHLAAERRI